jgi:pimeloyl-ACP methyl ester carboxylesterase
LRRVLVLFLLLAAGCRRTPAQTATDRLHPCAGEEGPTDAYCGTLRVFENRAARDGRTIDLKIVLLPALGRDAKPDPLFFLAGGPGQGAAKMARQIRDAFRRVQATRDVVLVDQRGTGKSNPLECRSESDALRDLEETDDVALARLRACLAGYDADPRFYTTPIAMDDLDDVRAHLGYETINLYGGSYGTRAALVYLRRHESHVRSVVLDGVAPTDMRLPLFFARDAQRALDKLLADCEADASCRAQYPNLAARARAVFARLDAQPARVRVTHPRTGETGEVTIRASVVANVVFGALYSPMMSSIVPEMIRRAEANDFQGLLALAFLGENAGENMSAGMQLSVICAEDFPRITPHEQARESAGSIFGAHLAARMKACEFWPKGSVDADYYKPVASAVPALVLSGELDPVTPPTWGDEVTKHLSNARHLVAPGTGHGVLGTACGVRLIHQFVESANAVGLDTGCLQAIRRPPFFLTPAGPDPAGTKAGAP